MTRQADAVPLKRTHRLRLENGSDDIVRCTRCDRAVNFGRLEDCSDQMRDDCAFRVRFVEIFGDGVPAAKPWWERLLNWMASR